MALMALRSCSRLPSRFSRCPPRKQPVGLLRDSVSRLSVPPAAGVPTSVRLFSSDRDQQQKVVVVGIPNPFMWFRTRIYYFLIRTYFDTEFNIEDFTRGARQAFSHVSSLLSRCQFAALDGLVTKDLVGKLEEKCLVLPSSYKSALSAAPDDIMYATPGDVGIYYDDDGRKFVSILMRFWYLTSARLPDDTTDTARVFRVGGEGDAETRRLLTANYEFQREFTKGVPADWTITRIEHSKLLD